MVRGDTEAAGDHTQNDEPVRRGNSDERHRDSAKGNSGRQEPDRATAIGPEPEERLDDGARHRRGEDEDGRERVREVEAIDEEREQRGKRARREVDRHVAAGEQRHRTPVQLRPHPGRVAAALLLPSAR